MKKTICILAAVLLAACGCVKPSVEKPGDGNQTENPSAGGDKPSEDGATAEKLYKEFLIPEAEDADGLTRAFPGAEGGGMYTTGGRGGKIIHVTNLNDSGTGSLRAAVSQSGARIVVFDVAGTIELKSDLKINYPDLTIAGQTAPGDGICIKNYSTSVQASNVIIRYLRFRLGDEAPWTEDQIAAGKADGQDAIWGRYQDNVILDHCSMSWSVDETASFYANENFTMQWCLIAESMKDCKLHTKGSHGYGGLWGGKNASFHHNILAHHDSRNARIDHPHIYEGDHSNPARRGNVDMRNNVIYNWGSNSTYGGEGGWFNVVNNYYKPGPSSKDRHYFVDLYGLYTSTCKSCGGSNIESGYANLHISGNVHTAYEDISSNNRNGIYWHNGSGHANYGSTLSAPLPICGKDGERAFITTHSAEQAMELAVKYAGASLSRDEVDKRISNDVKEGSGSLIADMAAVKSAYGITWPVLEATSDEIAALKDSDSDGMPDWFEEKFSLNKNDASDASAKTLDIKGRYSNFEMYLHYLVRDITAAQTQGGQYTKQ